MTAFYVLRSTSRFPPRHLPLSLARSRSRQIWTTATSSLSSLPDALDECLNALKSTSKATGQTPLCIVLASNHYRGSDLEQLPRAVSSVISPKTLIGTVVEGVGSGSTSTFGQGLSVSIVDKSVECDGFAVEEEAVRRVKQKAVGRWPEPRKGSAAGQESEAEGFKIEHFRSVSLGGGNFDLPESLKKLVPRSAPLILTFSDGEPHQFFETVDSSFPKSTKVGLIGSMTPFVTGQPRTLFYGDRVLSGGIVGAALSAPSIRPVISVKYPGLEELGDPLKITRCRGNIILSLDGSNAARELLARMGNRAMTPGMSADRQLYVRLALGTDSAMYRITGGDPSKGTLAIDTVKDLKQGMELQFMQHTGQQARQTSSTAIHFVTCDPDRPIKDEDAGDRKRATVHKSIYATTDGGFAIGSARPAGRVEEDNAVVGTVICDVPHAEVDVDIQ